MTLSPMTKKLIALSPFVLIFTALHWLLIRRFMLAGFNSRRTVAAMVVWCLLMIGGPTFVVNMDFIPSVTMKAGIALVVYIWMAFILLFTIWSHALRLVRVLLERCFRGGREPSWRLLSPRAELGLHLGVVGGLLLLGGWLAVNPRLERLEIRDSRIPQGASYRIAFISDLHLGVLGGIFNSKF